MIRDRAQLPVNGKVCRIFPTQDGLFELSAGGPVATDASPRWLSDSALESGAVEVKWDFDLRLAGDR